MRPFPAIFAPMPAADVPSLEQRLEARLLELDRLQRERPKAPGALRRAEMGRQIDDALAEIRELEQEIALARASTLADAAVQLRRLAAWIDASSPCCLTRRLVER